MKGKRRYEWRRVDGYRAEKEDRRGMVMDVIKNAKEMTVISSFLIADKQMEDAIVKKSKEGVRFYILTAAAKRLQQDVNGEFDEKARKSHVAMLKELSKHVMIRSSDMVHAKVIIADPHTNPAGVLLTANLTTEALDRNQELAVRLEQDEVVEAYGILRYMFWEMAEHEMTDLDHLIDCKPLGKVRPVDAQKVLQTTPDYKSIRDTIMKVLDDGSKHVTVSSFGWDADGPVVKKLCELAKGGTDVTVITRNRNATIPAMERLAESGARIVGFRWLHAKAVASDRSVLMTSANMERMGLEDGFELGLLITGYRTKALDSKLEEYATCPEYMFTNII